MRLALSPVRSSLFTVLLAVAVAACSSGPGDSLYVPDPVRNMAPVIESVTPSGVVLAGIDVITITGRNFSTTLSDNLVTFDDGLGAAARGEVLEATATQLRVRVPNLPNSALRLRVAVLGAPDYSNTWDLPLLSAAVPFGDLDDGTDEAVSGITSDASGTLYASLVRDGNSLGIVTFSPDGVRMPYFNTPFPWVDLAVGTDGVLYGVRRIRALFQLPAGSAQVTFATLPLGVALSAIVAAPNGDLWTAGTGSATPSLYRVRPDRSTSSVPFALPVRDLAIAAGALHVAAGDSTSNQVWRFPFAADGSITSGTVVFDVTAAVGPDVDVSTIAVATDGTIFVGLTGRTGAGPFDPIWEVPASGTPAPLYPGVLTPPVSGFAWGLGSQLYVAKAPIAATADQRAVPAQLLRLETRRPGPN